ncbi:glycoside hydrolase family 85 protein [Plenodomus tracheiphilus IPT5]|uniref:Glycoside hydrolase family 85 protein n=1 Tax=Plenodomus tracheiphilus IPT5 TaxID=1408161 RepID=A0A6A7BK05_9PLEO|nr:glycoside hydrolase family 85 protein [Plenodomus tracheiphilus IPT5]
MANLFGWKDILRPIRDGYRHLFPTPDTGPTPEERHRQRELDRLKGFTYFDTANTPLLPRRRAQTKHVSKADVLLVHDYAGNYHDYESVQLPGVTKKLYICEYLQHVDTFIYFSHKLVCVPPPTWTNTLHRNGVKALGTLLIEPQTKDSGRVLEHVTSAEGMTFPLVNKLVFIAQHYGFDGYLINVEKPFPSDVWDPKVLESFLSQLKCELGEAKQLVWYDALTTSNKVSYQNALNTSNITFAKACGSLLTNYCWTEADAESSKQLALRNDISLCKVFFGIDVWAQNTTTLSHPRVTYPEKGGGGTNTGVAVAKLTTLGLSAGIFAPAWSFEHFPNHEREVERAIWEGEKLPSDLTCTCGDCPSRHQANAEYAISKHAQEFAAGSENFFYTDSSPAFGRRSDGKKDLSGRSLHAQLGQQSILPQPKRVANDSITLTHFLDDTTIEPTLVIEATTISPPADPRIKQSDPWLYLPLYNLNMPLTRKLQLRSSLRKPAFPTALEIEVYIKIHGDYQILPTTQIRNGLFIDTILSGQQGTSAHVIEELGVRARGIATIKGPARVLWISSIGITPVSKHQVWQNASITNVHTIHRGATETQQLRLRWSYEDATSTTAAQGMPQSDITGLVSYFHIKIDERDLGRAYALEHVISPDIVTKVGDPEVIVEIMGVGFDGRKVVEWNGIMRRHECEEGYEWVGEEGEAGV